MGHWYYTSQRFRGQDELNTAGRASISPLPLRERGRGRGGDAGTAPGPCPPLPNPSPARGEGLVHQPLAVVLIYPGYSGKSGNRYCKLCRYLCPARGGGLAHQRLAVVLIHPCWLDKSGNRCCKLCRYRMAGAGKGAEIRRPANKRFPGDSATISRPASAGMQPRRAVRPAGFRLHLCHHLSYPAFRRPHRRGIIEVAS